jgi:7-keto-8-aminopelargonate synthetase-like enzyme
MYGRFQEYIQGELNKVREEGLYKQERVLTTSQGVEIRTESGLQVLNFCANNYLGLCNELRGKSRIRVRISAAHTPGQIAFAIDKFKKVGKKLGAV